MTRVEVSVGPVSAASARVWAASARATLDAIKNRPDIGVPGDVVDAFDAYLTLWEGQMDGEVFVWTGELDVDLLRHLAAHWARLANLARDDPSAGVQPADPAGQEFFDALAVGFASALASIEDDPDQFAPMFEEVVPDFAGVRRSDDADPSADRPVRVLLVDDNADIRMLVRIGLENSREFVVMGEACDGEEAVAAVSAGGVAEGPSCPDVILVDLSMPVMGGEEALPLLLERCPTARVVVFSANDTPEIRERVFKLGASTFVRKDAGIAEIVSTLRLR